MLIRACLIVLSAFSALTAADVSVNQDAIRKHAEQLLAIPEREAGFAGAELAADYIANSLREIGFENVFEQQTTISVPVYTKRELRIGETNHEVWPHRPNGAALPLATDITGKLLVADPDADYEPHQILGRVVLLPGDSEDVWIDFAKMGAVAILFNQPELIDSLQVSHQHLSASVNIPRAAVSLAAPVDGVAVTLNIAGRMQQRQAKSIVAHLAGTTRSSQPETVMLTTAYDASGVVSGNDPAATTAWNAALLLDGARALHAAPPRRDVLFVFHGGRIEAFKSVRQLLGGLRDQSDNLVTLPDVEWPRAPMSEATAVSLAYKLWRADLVQQDFEAFLAEHAESGTEADLKALFENIDSKPEDGDYFQDLNYAVTESTSATQQAQIEEAQDSGDNYLLRLAGGIIFALVAIGMVYFSATKGKPHAVLTGTVFVFAIFAVQVLVKPQTTSGETDINKEADTVAELGFRFVAEEAARRADELSPKLEALRLVRSLSGWVNKTPEVERRIASTMGILESLFGRTIDLEEVPGLIDDLDERNRAWRDIQQKLSKRDLNEAEREKLPDLIRAVVEGQNGTPSNIKRHITVLGNQLNDLRSSLRIRNALGITKTSGPDVRLVIAIDFTDGNEFYSSTTTSTLVTAQSDLRTFNVTAGRIAQRINDEAGGAFLIPFDQSPHMGGSSQVSWWPDGYLHEATFANLFCNAFTLSTVNDARLKVGSPSDTAAAFNQDVFLKQSSGLPAFLLEMIDSSMAGDRHAYNIPLKNSNIIIETMSQGSATGTKGFPYPYTELNFHNLQRHIKFGVRSIETHWGDAFGNAQVLYLPSKDPKYRGTLPLLTYGFADDGQISDIVASRGQSKTKGSSKPEFYPYNGIRTVKLQVFRAQSSAVFDVFDPRLLMSLPAVHILSSTKDSEPNQAHFELDRGTIVAYAPPGIPLRILSTVGQTGNRFLLLGDHIDKDNFAGLPPAANLASEPQSEESARERNLVPTSMATARDFLDISKSRLDRLQDNGISPQSIWALLAEGKRNLDAADEALAAGDVQRADGYGQAAWAYLGRVYPAVLSTANDVVYGLVVMLLIAVPFAVICERLFVAANTIIGKVTGFLSFFVVTFLFFFFFHPAFSLAATPVIIFLAFTIIVMSVVVIALLYQRFEQEMEIIRMAGRGGHTADMSRLGTVFATGQLGISNMRRRPLRTFLTAITVVLMTFILLTFASFSGSVGSRQLSQATTPVYDGVMVRMASWLEMPEDTVDRFEHSWGHDFKIYPRRWLMGFAERDRFPLNGPDAHSFVEGVIGVLPGDPTGIDAALVNHQGERGLQKDTLYLPAAVLDQMGLAVGASLRFQGFELIAGSIDEEVMGGITHLDGDPITPLLMGNLTTEELDELKQQAQQATSGEPPQESGDFTHLGPNSVAVLHHDIIEQLDGSIRSLGLRPYTDDEVATAASQQVTLTPRQQLDIGAVAEEMAQQTALTLRVGENKDTYLLTAVGKLSVAGLSDVIIPLILGGMIIFSTMLSSVAERGKEIFIYASLGLAPVHIAALFLVEAAIYAVLGGLGGYMLAQMLVAMLGFAADMGIGVQPDLNYSSFTAVATILLVMATVLLSAMYPALVASQSAKPGEDTEFKVPAPDGDHMYIPFPFTVAQRDVYGLLAFLTDYFNANTEASTGCFTAANAQMHTEGSRFEVTAKTWLAPFDLGISQNFKMTATQTDVKAIYKIEISLDLLSGQRSAWQRILLPFLKDLRKQFLVWRTLDQINMDRFRAKGGDPEAIARMEAHEAKLAEEAAKKEAGETQSDEEEPQSHADAQGAPA